MSGQRIWHDCGQLAQRRDDMRVALVDRARQQQAGQHQRQRFMKRKAKRRKVARVIDSEMAIVLPKGDILCGEEVQIAIDRAPIDAQSRGEIDRAQALWRRQEQCLQLAQSFGAGTQA